MRVFTCGLWTVKDGKEEEFIEGWRGLAEWATAEFPAAGQPTLLRDRDNPDRFISFGGWESLDDVDKFRSHSEFTRRVGELREMLDDFEPRTLDGVIDPGV